MKTTEPKYYDVTVYKLQSKIKNIIKFDDDDDDDVEYKEYLKLEYTTMYRLARCLNIKLYNLYHTYKKSINHQLFIFDYKIIFIIFKI